MTHLTLVHHSERFDRPLDRVQRDADAFRETADLVTRTEMGTGNREGILRAPGWSWCQSNLDNGHDETVAEWRNDSLSLSGMPWTHELTDMTYVRSPAYGGQEAATVKALVVPLAVADKPRQGRVYLVSAHMPTDNTDLRAKVWIDCCEGLRRLVRGLRRADEGAQVIIAADWNKNYREANERAMIERHVCDPLDMRQAWDGNVPESGGTHGPRGLIDGFVVDKSIEVEWCRLLRDTDGSDHRPFAARLNVG